MSAFVVDKVHIDVIVAGLRGGTRGAGLNARAIDPDATGAELVAENVVSVACRYPDDDVEAGELPGPADPYYLRGYRWTDPGFRPTAAEMYAAVRCLEYQSCEHPGWEGSAAAALCAGVRAEIEATVSAARRYARAAESSGRPASWPAYDAAPWEFTTESAAVSYALAHRTGRALVAAVATDPTDRGAHAALSDWLIGRGVIAHPLDAGRLTYRAADLARHLRTDTAAV